MYIITDKQNFKNFSELNTTLKNIWELYMNSIATHAEKNV